MGLYLDKAEGAYIWGANWVTYLWVAYSGDLYMGGILTGFYGISLLKDYQ